jgi:hypothetical protein
MTHSMSKKEAEQLLIKAIDHMGIALEDGDEKNIKKYKKDIGILVNIFGGMDKIPKRLQKRTLDALNEVEV